MLFSFGQARNEDVLDEDLLARRGYDDVEGCGKENIKIHFSKINFTSDGNITDILHYIYP